MPSIMLARRNARRRAAVKNYSDSFTGTDGSAPAAAWSAPIGGTATIQSNALSITGASSAANAGANLPLTNSVYADGSDIYVTITQTSNSFPAIVLFGGSGTQTTNNSGPVNGYYVYFNSGFVSIRQRNPTQSELASATPAFTIGSAWRVRINRSGSNIQVKIWAAGSAEPASYTLTGTATTTYDGAIALGLVATSSPSGTGSVSFDDFVLSGT